jgi:hypothetical protein
MKLATIIYSIALSISFVDAWSVTVETQVWPGAWTLVSWWGDGIPAMCNVQLATQNADKNFTTMDQTATNIPPTKFYHFSINSNTPVGLNYYVIVSDVSNSSNFAVSNPFTVYEPFGDAHPTASVTADGSLVYKTANGSSVWPNTAKPTSSSNSSHHSSVSLAIPVIVGIVIGCVAFVVIVLVCLIKCIIVSVILYLKIVSLIVHLIACTYGSNKGRYSLC